MNLRRFLIGVALLASVVAAVFAPDETPKVVPPGKVHPQQHRETHAETELLQLNFRASMVAPKPFMQKSWQATPIPFATLAPEPTPQPVVPTLPFKLIGQYVENGRIAVFMSMGERNFVAREGDTIEDVYRIEKLTEEELVLTYLPLGKTQRISLTNGN